MLSHPLKTLVRALALFCLAQSAAQAGLQTAVEREIAHLEKDVNDAYAANHLDKYFGYYADDLVAIFYNARSTLADYRKFWTESVRAGNPVVSVKISDLVVRVSPAGDSAIASYQIDVRNRHADGRTTDEHAFETDVWLRRGGAWKIAHAHYALATPPPS
jgi:ketosteroid isomerase-like protein